MFQTPHTITPGEAKALESYRAYKEQHPKPRKNLIRLVRHINMLNPLPDQNSWSTSSLTASSVTSKLTLRCA